MRVPWEDLGHEKYENMVATLLQRRYENVQRIDGRGGDGGRDVQIVDPQDGAIIEIFELKSFTRRMRKDRRRQVERSLKKAARLNPLQWTLVVPIDPTAGELEWFDKLRKRYRFQLRWCGKTWLDEKMSECPDIRSYVLEDETARINAKLVELL